MMQEKQGHAGKIASNPERVTDASGPNASSNQPTHDAEQQDGRKDKKHAGHDLDSGQFSQSGSRSR